VINNGSIVPGHGETLLARVSAVESMAISKQQQFAEKLHAYMARRPDAPNSRVKDLVDMSSSVIPIH
jgi:hypothetical protein